MSVSTMSHNLERDADQVASLTRRIMSEFSEMPGLQLQLHQAARFWAVDPVESAAVLERLVKDGFLRKRRDGAYLRASRI